MKWKDTPFDSLARAHKMAEKYDLKPTGICTSEGESIFRYFQCLAAKKKTTIVAQRLDGNGQQEGPVREVVVPNNQRLPLQDPTAKSFSDEDRFTVGLWCRSKHTSLEAAVTHFKHQFTNPDEIEQADLTILRTKDLEYEYMETDRGAVYVRVLEKSK